MVFGRDDGRGGARHTGAHPCRCCRGFFVGVCSAPALWSILCTLGGAVGEFVGVCALGAAGWQIDCVGGSVGVPIVAIGALSCIHSIFASSSWMLASGSAFFRWLPYSAVSRSLLPLLLLLSLLFASGFRSFVPSSLDDSVAVAVAVATSASVASSFSLSSMGGSGSTLGIR